MNVLILSFFEPKKKKKQIFTGGNFFLLGLETAHNEDNKKKGK